jgi:hypothetical protein
MLAASSLPRCHALHYLQMTTEKLSKAYRLTGELGATPENVRGHTRVEAFVLILFRSPKSLDRLRLHQHTVRHERKKFVATALEVEKLAPAADPQSQPRNAEYPWEVGGSVRIPADEAFADLDLQSREMIRFLKLVRLAVEDFEVVEPSQA